MDLEFDELDELELMELYEERDNLIELGEDTNEIDEQIIILGGIL